MRHGSLLAACALANAALYSALLPLWEGFDEPFHYGYVQHFAAGGGLPDPRVTLLPDEIAASLPLAPAGRPVQRNLPVVSTYSQYFAAKPAVPLRTVLWERPKAAAPRFLNYQAHHAPLAYALLAIPETLLKAVPLPGRVLALRWIAACSGALLLLWGAGALFDATGLGEPLRPAALFCLFSCQMTWATIAHIANDWLSVPLAVWTIALAARYAGQPRLKAAACAASVAALGLLAKSYFLGIAPAVVLIAAWRRRWKDAAVCAAILVAVAGPWYWRNQQRYGSPTGMLESRAGTALPEALDVTDDVPWPRVVLESARRALWTGNNSFTSFSRATLGAVIAAWGFALLLWAVRRPRSAPEWAVAGQAALFLCALAYMTAVTFAHTRGLSVGPSPWFNQPILAPMLGLAFLGCARSGLAGRVTAAILTAAFGYILIATYWAKLIPWYGGYEGRAQPVPLLRAYASGEIAARVNLTALLPGWAVLGLAAAVALLTIAAAARICRSIMGWSNVPTGWGR